MAITAKVRKSLLTFSLGAAVAFAQAPSPVTPPADKKTTDAHGHGNHSADHGMSSNKGAGLMVGKQDEEFLRKAAQGTMMEIEATRLAQEKASNSEVKAFARKLEQDHQKANEQLKQLAAEKNVELPADMGKHAAMVEKIRNLSGDKFDKEFMKMQVSHHKKDVSEFQKQTSRSMDSDVRAFATATLPTLQQHLQEAQGLQGSTRGRSVDTPATTSAPSPDSAAKPDAATNPTR